MKRSAKKVKLPHKIVVKKTAISNMNSNLTISLIKPLQQRKTFKEWQPCKDLMKQKEELIG